MNKITKRDNEYFVEYEGQENEELVNIWFEKKSGKYHLKLKKGNPSNREFIRLDVFEKGQINGVYEFETKMSGPRTIGTTNWQSRMTDEEFDGYNSYLEQIEDLKTRVNELKEIVTARAPKELTPAEKLQKKIDELLARQAALMAKRGN